MLIPFLRVLGFLGILLVDLDNTFHYGAWQQESKVWVPNLPKRICLANLDRNPQLLIGHVF